MERLFLYYRGKRIEEIRSGILSGYDSESIWLLDDKTLIINHFNGEFNTAKHYGNDDFSIWMNGIYVHKDKGIGCCIDDDLFRSMFHSALQPEEIPAMFVNGAFCGLIITPARTMVFNDFMGLCPVYYYHEKGEIIISNSFRLVAGMVKTTLSKSALTEYLLTGNNFSGETAALEIRCMGPASVLSFGKNYRISLSNYDSFSARTEIRRKFDDVADEISQLFHKSINRLYDSRIKYSMSMTGGIDSRLIYLEWQDKLNLLTETAGEGSSDFLKARQIIERLGNPALHSLEELFPEQYADGIDSYYQNCDNPLKAMGEFNSHHLDWKVARGSFLHISGVGGELLDGENLYLSRNKWSVLREGIAPYSYHELKDRDKANLICNVLGMGNKRENLLLLAEKDREGFEPDRIVAHLEKFIGKTKFSQCYTERFRTYRLANAGYYLAGSQNLAGYLTLLPFNDTELMKEACRYHPSTRELRKLTLAMLKSYKELHDIPVDTTHLKIKAPYKMQRFFRVLRMVFNVGYHKKIPLLQKGKPPVFRAFPYFDQKNQDFRELVNNRLLSCNWFDQDEMKKYVEAISGIRGFNFYLHHGAEANILILLRLTYMEKMLGF
jgi:hypothetical protein